MLSLSHGKSSRSFWWDFIHLTGCCRSIKLIKEGPKKKSLNLMLLTEEFSNIGWMVIGSCRQANGAKVKEQIIYLLTRKCLNAGNGGLHPTPCQTDHIEKPNLTRVFPSLHNFNYFANHVISAKKQSYVFKDIISFIRSWEWKKVIRLFHGSQKKYGID